MEGTRKQKILHVDNLLSKKKIVAVVMMAEMSVCTSEEKPRKQKASIAFWQ